MFRHDRLVAWLGITLRVCAMLTMYGSCSLELAHGSNVAGVETTATFDEKTDEFVIHTPHLGATKWWIGGQ